MTVDDVVNRGAVVVVELLEALPFDAIFHGRDASRIPKLARHGDRAFRRDDLALLRSCEVFHKKSPLALFQDA